MAQDLEGTSTVVVTREVLLEKELAWEKEKSALLTSAWERERELLLRPFKPEESNSVGIFWDFENCSPPLTTNPSALIKHLRTVFQPYGPIVFIRCYQDVASQPVFAANLRSGLEACGVEVRDCGRWGRKDVADHHIMADMLLHAIDHPAPSTVVLISGDKDFSYLLSNLRNRKYNTILVENPVGAAEELKSAANKVFKWKDLLAAAGGSKIPLSSVPGPEATINTPRRPRANSDPESMSPATKALVGKQPAFFNSPATKTPSKSYGSYATTTPSKPSANISPKPRSFFRPLVEVLEARPTFPAPLRSFVSPLVTQHTAAAFTMVGVNTWKEYVDTAVASGVVTVGSGDKLGMEWISLARVDKALKTPRPLDPAASPSSSGTPRKHLITALLGSTPKRDLPHHELFRPLIELLSSLPSDPPPLRFIASALLSAKQPDLIAQFGWKNIVTKAQELGLVELGGGVNVGDGRAEWISLRDAFRQEPSNEVDKVIPPFNEHTADLFEPLINLLNSLPTPSDPTKIPAASRSRLAAQLKETHPDAFTQVAAKDTMQFFELARRMGVVRLGFGKEPGSEWCALRREYRKTKEVVEGGGSSSSPVSTPLRTKSGTEDPIVSAPATPLPSTDSTTDPLSNLFNRSLNLSNGSSSSPTAGRKMSPLPSRMSSTLSQSAVVDEGGRRAATPEKEPSSSEAESSSEDEKSSGEE